jgi:hypothetical protein
MAVFVAGCGGSAKQPAASTQTTAPATASSTTAPPGGGDGLPGERVEIYPYKDAKLAVVGVAHDDTLRVRSKPGVDHDVVFELAPLGTADATGHNRSLGEAGFWSEVTAEGKTGWANTSYLLQPGRTTDETAALYPEPADRPVAETMQQLADTVARRVSSSEPPSRIVVVEAPAVGDLGEITVDVIGLGDDSQGGERLKVFAEPEPSANRFRLRTVEATALCSRGVTPEGLCV